jgi:hypothetical protein
MLLSEEAQELYQTLLEVKTVLGKVPTAAEKAYGEVDKYFIGSKNPKTKKGMAQWISDDKIYKVMRNRQRKAVENAVERLVKTSNIKRKIAESICNELLGDLMDVEDYRIFTTTANKQSFERDIPTLMKRKSNRRIKRNPSDKEFSSSRGGYYHI